MSFARGALFCVHFVVSFGVILVFVVCVLYVLCVFLLDMGVWLVDVAFGLVLWLEFGGVCI